ncbi:ABC transporter permease [Rhizobium sp. 18055]|uniref:ABC transporter permease n=1 Tax=Rhizobium sp. 18055 TaxID=2681403 RepID=UPI00135B3382|nr:ABC transporter permease [Rhizobium sp. 18055]
MSLEIESQTRTVDGIDNISMWKSLAALPAAPSAIFLVVAVCVIGAFTNGFLTVANIQGILEQAVLISIVALAVNQVILSGEIDVSTGSLLAVCAFVYGNVADVAGPWGALLAALVVGGLIGTFNGVVSTYARVPSIITTLGMLFILRGAVLLFGGAQVLNMAPEWRIFGQGLLIGIPVTIVLTILVFVAMEIASRHTVWGRNTIAIGGNESAARTLGLPIRQTKIVCFVLSGLGCGLAAAVFLGQIGQLQATAATGFELKVIAAVVLGGTSIKGGRGSNVSPIVGAILVGVILNAMTLNRVPGTFELLVLGSLILGAVSFEGIRQRLLAKGH